MLQILPQKNHLTDTEQSDGWLGTAEISDSQKTVRDYLNDELSITGK